MLQVSVIIPAYKVEKTIRDCIESVLNQSYKDYEIILVDDGSPDNTGKICDEYREKYPFITVIHQSNGGVSKARNEGLKAARGKRVMFLDSDDTLTPDSLKILCRHDADMVIGSINVVSIAGKLTEQVKRRDEMILKPQYGDKLPALITEERFNYLHGKLFRKSIIDKNQIVFEEYRFTSAEDTVFIFEYLKYCKSIFVSGKTVHNYMYTPEGLARKFFKDRYARMNRLFEHITRCCVEAGVYSGDVKTAVEMRRIGAAGFVIKLILRQKDLSRAEKLGCLDEIYRDETLNAEGFDCLGADRVNMLKKQGSKKLLKSYHQKCRKDRRSYIKSTGKMYSREALRRARIIK